MHNNPILVDTVSICLEKQGPQSACCAENWGAGFYSMDASERERAAKEVLWGFFFTLLGVAFSSLLK